MTKTLLKVSGLKVAYGGIQAVKDVDFEVNEGELAAAPGEALGARLRGHDD